MSGSSSDWDPVRAWLATVAGTSSDVLEATSASVLLGRRIREITGTFASDVRSAPPPTTGTSPRSYPEAQASQGPRGESYVILPVLVSKTLKRLSPAAGHPGSGKKPKLGIIPFPGAQVSTLRQESWITKKGVWVSLPGIPSSSS